LFAGDILQQIETPKLPLGYAALPAKKLRPGGFAIRLAQQTGFAIHTMNPTLLHH
jgi:hypothetical protein